MSFDGLIRSARRKPLVTAGESTRAVELGRAEIERMVPHREPFLLVDRISAVDLEQQAIVGHRLLDPQDPVFRGHFPGDPVYPGVLLVEAMAQLSICLQHLCAVGRVDVQPGDQPPRVRLLRLHHALFIDEARPGDTLTLLGKVVEDNGYTATLAGQVMKDDIICTMAIMEALQLDG